MGRRGKPVKKLRLIPAEKAFALARQFQGRFGTSEATPIPTSVLVPEPPCDQESTLSFSIVRPGRLILPTPSNTLHSDPPEQMAA